MCKVKTSRDPLKELKFLSLFPFQYPNNNNNNDNMDISVKRMMLHFRLHQKLSSDHHTGCAEMDLL